MLPNLRILVQPDALRPTLEPLLDECGLSANEMCNLLIDDIESLVSTFADVTRSEFVDVRLERIDHDACRKFHRDNVEARLVTTYRGPTTQWVEMAYAETALREQKLFGGPLKHLASDDVAIFKGSCAGSKTGLFIALRLSKGQDTHDCFYVSTKKRSYLRPSMPTLNYKSLPPMQSTKDYRISVLRFF